MQKRCLLRKKMRSTKTNSHKINLKPQPALMQRFSESSLIGNGALCFMWKCSLHWVLFVSQHQHTRTDVPTASLSGKILGTKNLHRPSLSTKIGCYIYQQRKLTYQESFINPFFPSLIYIPENKRAVTNHFTSNARDSCSHPCTPNYPTQPCNY